LEIRGFLSNENMVTTNTRILFLSCIPPPLSSTSSN
jgi:hypothetical protein